MIVVDVAHFELGGVLRTRVGSWLRYVKLEKLKDPRSALLCYACRMNSEGCCQNPSCPCERVGNYPPAVIRLLTQFYTRLLLVTTRDARTGLRVALWNASPWRVVRCRDRTGGLLYTITGQQRSQYRSNGWRARVQSDSEQPSGSK